MTKARLGLDQIPFRRIRHSTITHNVIALYGTQIATYAFPLVTVPYLARVLGPFQWGLVAFAQALGVYLSIMVDFGFQLSATRRIARLREDREQLADIVAGVIGAKVLIALTCLVAVVVLRHFMHLFREHERILWAGSLSGIGQGFSMLWFYQGLERLRMSAAMDVAGKALAAVGVFLFVHRQEDAWRVPALQCVCYCGVSLTLLAIAYREVCFRFPTPTTTWSALRESAAMFLFRSAASLYTTANTLILGAVATPIVVAFYFGAERLTNALLGLLNPVSQSLYPRLSHLIARDRPKALQLARMSLAVMGGGGILLCVAVHVAAPLMVRVILGPGYEPAIKVMHILSLLLPAIALSNVLGIQWMLPLGMDAAFNKIIISAGLLNLVLALWWASRWQQLGMAWAVVVSEGVVTISMFVFLISARKAPFALPSVLRRRAAEDAGISLDGPAEVITKQ